MANSQVLSPRAGGAKLNASVFIRYDLSGSMAKDDDLLYLRFYGEGHELHTLCGSMANSGARRVRTR